jgi:hypothetical protein
MTTVHRALVQCGPVIIETDRSKYAEQIRKIRDEFHRDVLDGM